MGTSSTVIILPITITNGSTISNVAQGWKSFGGSSGMWIMSPTTLPDTVRIQVTYELLDDGAVGTNWFNYFDGSPLAQQYVPAAGTASPYVFLVAVRALRLVASSAVAADRVFYLTMQATN